MAAVLNEQSRRRFVALEAQALGRGGVSVMTRTRGLAHSTIYHGLCDIRHEVSARPEYVRKAGGGRKRTAVQDPTLVVDLNGLIEPATRGDPMRPLLRTTRSLRNLSQALARPGAPGLPERLSATFCAAWVIACRPAARRGKATGISIATANFNTSTPRPGRSWRRRADHIGRHEEEGIGGNFKNNAREWRPKGLPKAVNIHDFIDPKLSRAVPCGIYDITNNAGWVNVGTNHDTASFAANAIRRWWRTIGKKRHPKPGG